MFKIQPLKNSNTVLLRKSEGTYLSNCDIIKFGKILNYEVTGKTYICGFSQDIIEKINKYPVFNIVITYDKKYVSGYLFSIVCFYHGDIKYKEETDGYYTIEFIDIEEMKNNYKTMIKDEIFNENVVNFGKMDDNNLVKKIDNELKERINKMEEKFKIIRVEKYTVIDNMVDNLKLMDDDIILKTIKYQLLDNDNKRRGDSSFDIPKKVIKLSDVINTTEKDIEELINENGT